MRKLGALMFPGFELLDVFGPLEMFGMLPDDFEMVLVAQKAGPVASKQGPRALADCAVGDRETFDMVFLPGGRGTRREIKSPRLLQWIDDQARRAEWVLTVCTGSALLAATGHLDRRLATTNKLAFDWVAAQRSEVNWQRRARWTKDGRFFTSSGVSAGMDMSLAAIARMHDTETAERVARWCEYSWSRDPLSDPFAKPEPPRR